MGATAKRIFISGVPWWGSAAYLGMCSFFALLCVALRAWHPLCNVFVMVIGFLIFRAISPAVYLGHQGLHIRRMGREIVIPLGQVAGIDETKPSWPFRSYSATIRFAVDTPFGRSLYLGALGIVPSITFRWALEELRRAMHESNEPI